MRGLAAFIMRGRLQALAFVTATSLVSLLAWAGGAAVALVALRRGLLDGIVVAVGATLALAAILGLAFGLPAVAARSLLELWLPVLLLATWLRSTVSLGSTLRLAAVLAALAVLGLHLAIPDQAKYWDEFLAQMDPLFASGSEQAWQAVRARMRPVMAGLVVLIQLTLVLGSLLLGRWWQSLLYNPGGFRSEFHSLDLGRSCAITVAVVLGGAMWFGPGLLYDVALVTSAVFVLQALALAHAAAALKGLGRGWLLILYLLLPFVFELLVVAGIADAVFGWRRRLQEQAGPGGPA